MIEQPMENRKWFQKRDLLLILLVGAAAAVLFFWPKEQGAAAVISQEGRELYCIDLTQVEAPYDISIGGEYPLVTFAGRHTAPCPLLESRPVRTQT